MLTGITLENFKAFKTPQHIPIVPITLVFGPNSSGKSSIIHALAFLQFVFETKGYCDPDIVEFGWSNVHLGSWRNLVYGHDPTASMRISLHGEEGESITWTFEQSEEVPKIASFLIEKGGMPIARGTNTSRNLIRWKIELHRSHGLWRVYRGHLLESLLNTPWEGKISEPFNSYFDSWLGHDWVPLPEHLETDTQCCELFPANLSDSVLVDVDEHKSFDRMGFDPKLFLDALELQESDEIFSILQESLNILEWYPPDNKMERSFISQLYVGNSRNLPTGILSRRSLPHAPVTKPWLTLIDNRLDENRLTTPRDELNRMLKSLEIEYSVRTRLRKETILLQHEGNRDSILLEEALYVSQEELVFQDRNNVLHPIHALGSGMGKVLPNLVAMASSDVELLIMEEPESNIHPRLQAALGDVVIESLNAPSEKDLGEYLEEPLDPYDSDFYQRPPRNVLIETHSEHLILRMLRRIRETTEQDFSTWSDKLKEKCPNGIRPQDIAVLYVKPGEEGAEVIELPVDANGEFTCDWPGGFFEERMKELF